MTAPLPIPLTKGKTPRSITIKALSNLDIDYTTTPIASIVSELASAKKIGAIEKIEISQEIDLTAWRELDADQGGQIVEYVPGKETIQLTIGGIILYSGDILDAFGFDVDTLLAIRAPIVIEVNERRPLVGGGTQSRSTFFLGVWFKNRPVTYDISGDYVVKQTVSAYAARIIRTSF